MVRNQLFCEMLDVMDAAFQDYMAVLPEPGLVQQGSQWAYRYKDRDIHHAVVLKLALVQSALRAALVLLKNGHVMEQAMLQRIVDEANEDILFLVYAVTNDTVTPLHQRYLAAFWAEEFSDFDNPTSSHQSREMVPRRKIRAYLARIEGKNLDPSRAAQVAQVISKTYSGFVHGASPHIMEIYGGEPPHFHVRGMAGTPKMAEYGNDLWNYMYRGLLSHIFAAKMFGSQKHVDLLAQHKQRFEMAAGKDYSVTED